MFKNIKITFIYKEKTNEAYLGRMLDELTSDVKQDKFQDIGKVIYSSMDYDSIVRFTIKIQNRIRDLGIFTINGDKFDNYVFMPEYNYNISIKSRNGITSKLNDIFYLFKVDYYLCIQNINPYK